MADDKFFGKGIKLAGGFDLGAAKPLDYRLVVNNEEELAEHIAKNRAYEGMVVYVKSTGKSVQFRNEKWEDFGFDEVKVGNAVNGMATTIRGEFAAEDAKLVKRIEDLEGLVVGGEGEGLEAILGDVADLQEAVGAPAVEGAEGEEGTPASGLFEDVAVLEGRVDALEDKDEELAGKINDLELALGEGGSVDEQIQGALEPVGERIGAVEGDVEELQGAVEGLGTTISEGDAAVVTQLQGEMATAVGTLEEADEALGGRIATLEAIEHHDHENKAVLDGITAQMVESWEGKATVKQVQDAQQAAQDYADDKIGELIGCAEEDIHTLHALSEAIKANGAEFEGYVTTFNQALADKVDKNGDDRLVTLEEVAKWNAKAEVGDVTAAIQTAKDHTDAEIVKVNASITEVSGGLEAANGEIEGIKEVIGDSSKGLIAQIAAAQAKADLGVTNAALAQERADKGVADAGLAQQAADAAQQAAEKAQDEIDALEEVVGVEAKEGVVATGLFAQIAALHAKDAELAGADATLLSRINALEGLITGDEEVGGLKEIQDNISTLQSQVGQKPDENGEGGYGLFADIATLQAKDAVLQKAIEDEAAEARKQEGLIRGEFAAADKVVEGKITTLSTTLTTAIGDVEKAYKEADAGLVEDIAELQNAINALNAKDSTVEKDIAALKGLIGEEAVEGDPENGVEPKPANGLIGEIRALQAKDTELQGSINGVAGRVGTVEGDVTALKGAVAENKGAIDTLVTNVPTMINSIRTEIREDGRAYTMVGEREVGSTEVAVVSGEEVTELLANIFAPAVEE